jgi:sugar lactone lactonase YvrE
MNNRESSRLKFVTNASYVLAAAAAMLMTLTNIVYAASAASHSSKSAAEALWVANNDGNFISEFANGALDSSGIPAPNRINLSSNLNEPWGIVFDSSKDLWVSNVGNGTLTKFTFSQLKALNKNQVPVAKVVISGLDRPEGMAFDKKHNLWVANEGNGELLEFTSKQLKKSGSPVPTTTLSSSDLSSPVGIVFDSTGGIWVGDDHLNDVAMFTAAQLKEGGTQSATVLLTDDGSGSLDTPEPVAFDADGSLWVANNTDPVLQLGTVVKFSSSQLTSTGSPTPAVILTATTVTGTSAESFDIPCGLAFDKQGNLWVGNDASDQNGSLEEFTPEDLSASGSPQPAVFLDSNAVGTNIDGPLLISFGPVLP